MLFIKLYLHFSVASDDEDEEEEEDVIGRRLKDENVCFCTCNCNKRNAMTRDVKRASNLQTSKFIFEF